MDGFLTHEFKRCRVTRFAAEIVRLQGFVRVLQAENTRGNGQSGQVGHSDRNSRKGMEARETDHRSPERLLACHRSTTHT